MITCKSLHASCHSKLCTFDLYIVAYLFAIIDDIWSSYCTALTLYTIRRSYNLASHFLWHFNWVKCEVFCLILYSKTLTGWCAGLCWRNWNKAFRNCEVWSGRGQKEENWCYYCGYCWKTAGVSTTFFLFFPPFFIFLFSWFDRIKSSILFNYLILICI